MKVVVVVDVKGTDVPIKSLATAIEAVVGVAVQGKPKTEVFISNGETKSAMKRRKPAKKASKRSNVKKKKPASSVKKVA